MSYDPTSYTVTEGGTVTVTVKLSADSEREVAVPITVETGGTATASDYSGVPTSVTFASGETAKTFIFTSTGDTVDEPDETVNLGFGSLPDGVSEGAGPTATVTIADDDNPVVTVSYRPTAYTVDEGGNVVVTVVLSAVPEREVIVPITVESGDTATASDYSGVFPISADGEHRAEVGCDPIHPPGSASEPPPPDISR